jgi:hypothetical protein
MLLELITKCPGTFESVGQSVIRCVHDGVDTGEGQFDYLY